MAVSAWPSSTYTLASDQLFAPVVSLAALPPQRGNESVQWQEKPCGIQQVIFDDKARADGDGFSNMTRQSAKLPAGTDTVFSDENDHPVNATMKTKKKVLFQVLIGVGLEYQTHNEKMVAPYHLRFTGVY